MERWLQREIHIPIAAVSRSVFLVATGVREVFIGLVGHERLDCLRDTLMKRRPHGGEDGGARGGRFNAPGHANLEAGNVRLDLSPQRSLCPAANHRETPDFEARLTHGLQDVAQGKGTSFQ